MSSIEGSGASRAADLSNEDAFLVDDELGLYVVCDGSSDGPGGEAASEIAIAALEGFVERAEAEHGPVLSAPPMSTRFADQAVRHAIDAVLAASANDPEKAGMATTLSMLLILGGRGVIGHTGDSRVYRIRNRRLSQLTFDHDHSEGLASESSSPDSLRIDTFAVDLEPDDVFVLVTDGAEHVLETEGLTRRALDFSPQLLASRIAGAAHRARRDEDATVVVVRVRQPHDAASLALSGRPSQASFGHALASGAPRPGADGGDEVDDALDEVSEEKVRRPSTRTRRRLPASEESLDGATGPSASRRKRPAG